MTTIDPNQSLQQVKEAAKAGQKKKAAAGNGFDAIFNQALKTPTAESAQAIGPQPVSEIRPPQFSTNAPSPAEQVADRVDRLVDTMGKYQEKLLDNNASMKEIEPLVSKMVSQSRSLSAASEAVTGENEIRRLADQALMLSSQEIAKYYSGHYNE